MVPGPKFYNAVLCTDYVCRESISWPHRENCKSITKIINRDFVIRLCAPLANRDWLPMFADDSISSTLNFSSLPVEALCQHRKENPWKGNVLVRAANLKLLGTKILELPKPFRVQTWKYLKNFSEVRTYLNSKFEFQVFPSLLENTLTHFLLLFDIIKRNVWSSSKFFSLYS